MPDPTEKKKSKNQGTFNYLRGTPYYKTRISQTKPKDTVHARTDKGYKIAVAKDSGLHKMSKKLGTVPSKLRGRGTLTEKTDPLSVKNYRAPKK